MNKKYKVSKLEKNEVVNRKTVYNIQEICASNNWKKIAVISSTKYKFNNVVSILDSTMKKEGFVGYTFKEILPITMFYEALSEVKMCDAVILVEKYCYSTCKEFNEIMALLKENKIPIVGVVTLKG